MAQVERNYSHDNQNITEPSFPDRGTPLGEVSTHEEPIDYCAADENLLYQTTADQSSTHMHHVVQTPYAAQPIYENKNIAIIKEIAQPQDEPLRTDLDQSERKENEPAEWVPITEMPEQGYWWGKHEQSRFMLDRRMQVNMKGLDQVSRCLNLPPIQLISAASEPKRAIEPEMVGHEEAGFKINLIQYKSEERHDREYYTIYEHPTHRTLHTFKGKKDISIGYQFGLQTYAIHDDTRGAGRDTKKEESNYIDGVNQTLWNGIQSIQAKEMFDIRSGGSVRVMGTDIFLSLMGHLLADQLGDLSSLALKLDNNFWRDLARHFTLQGAVSGASKAALDSFVDKGSPELIVRSKSSQGLLVSNKWRQEEFKEQFNNEKHGPPLLVKLAARSIPLVGLILENRVHLSVLKTKIKKLVRLTDE